MSNENAVLENQYFHLASAQPNILASAETGLVYNTCGQMTAAVVKHYRCTDVSVVVLKDQYGNLRYIPKGDFGMLEKVVSPNGLTYYSGGGSNFANSKGSIFSGRDHILPILDTVQRLKLIFCAELGEVFFLVGGEEKFLHQLPECE